MSVQCASASPASAPLHSAAVLLSRVPSRVTVWVVSSKSPTGKNISSAECQTLTLNHRGSPRAREPQVLMTRRRGENRILEVLCCVVSSRQLYGSVVQRFKIYRFDTLVFNGVSSRKSITRLLGCSSYRLTGVESTSSRTAAGVGSTCDHHHATRALLCFYSPLRSSAASNLCLAFFDSDICAHRC